MAKVLTLLILAGVAATGYGKEKAPPNVVVFLADDPHSPAKKSSRVP